MKPHQRREAAYQSARSACDYGVRICPMQGADSMYENFAKRLLGDILTTVKGE